MFEFLKRKKNKKRDVRIECVYAGPEEMRRRAGRTDRKQETEQPEKPRAFRPEDFEMTTVYAGPSGREAETPRAEPEDAEIMDVYGGPGMMDELGWEGTEDAESESDSMMQGVYAGPQMPDPAPTMMVYAGPQTPNPSQMLFVYAGPDYFSGKKNPNALEAQLTSNMMKTAPYPQNYAAEDSEEEKPKVPRRFCPECGKLVSPDQTVCDGCGNVLVPGAEPQNPPMAPVYAGPEYWSQGKA